MTRPRVTDALLTGRDEQSLVDMAGGHRLQQPAAEAFARLQADAAEAGFQLAVASSYRSFERQCLIWNGKASGRRPVHDDEGNPVAMDDLPEALQLRAILRFSALPGTSRHHWGTDIDVYDAAAIPADYQVQLTPAEVAPGGFFDELHCWLDQRMTAGRSHGFYRPYSEDRGGVAPERWHLSYAPLARACEPGPGRAALLAAWDTLAAGESLALRQAVEVELEEILARYVRVPADWCPAP